MGRSLTPAPGMPRPMQRGSFMLAAGSNLQVDLTINPVDPAKAQLAVNGWYVQNVASLGANNDTALVWEIINATTIRFSRPQASGSSSTIVGKWELKSWS